MVKPTPTIWMSGRFVPWHEANVHVLTHALHYGTGVFDSLRVYATDRGPAIFRHREHHERLERSAALYRMPLPFTVDELAAATREVVARTGLEECYVRTLAYRGAGAMGVSPKDAPVEVAIAAWGWGAYLGDGATEGIRARISSWRRIDHDTLLPAAKATAYYLNSVLARTEAEADGYDEAILLGADGMLAEGSGENVFLVTGGRLVTPPLATGALGGITRATVLELAEALGIPYEIRPVTRGELYTCDELLLTGTAAELTPVRELDRRPVGTGEPGLVWRRLRAAFDAAAHGRDRRFSHWLDVVPGGVRAAA
jgi:branched-chain amino acid aminotransferase